MFGLPRGSLQFGYTIYLLLHKVLQMLFNLQTLSRPLPDEQTGRGSDGHNLVISPQTDQFISIVQLNAADGASKDRRPKLISWLEDQARAGVNIVTFCEINGWDELESSNDVEKNRPLIAKIASDGNE